VDRKRESTLIKAAKSGDKRALSALYRANVDKIYRYIFYRVENAEVAQDITSEVFLRMVESFPSYEDRSVPLLVWLYRIAHARVVDHYRRGKKRANDESLETLEIGDFPDLDTGLISQYKSSQLQKALLALTDSQRQVILLRFVEGLNLEQTSQAMSKTVDAIKAMQYRALHTLAQALKAQGYTPED
jgi:RNA polymerase sigma-70 factor, ECF subfamily